VAVGDGGPPCRRHCSRWVTRNGRAGGLHRLSRQGECSGDPPPSVLRQGLTMIGLFTMWAMGRGSESCWTEQVMDASSTKGEQ
jgi:hypothetical protein